MLDQMVLRSSIESALKNQRIPQREVRSRSTAIFPGEPSFSTSIRNTTVAPSPVNTAALCAPIVIQWCSYRRALPVLVVIGVGNIAVIWNVDTKALRVASARSMIDGVSVSVNTAISANRIALDVFPNLWVVVSHYAVIQPVSLAKYWPGKRKPPSRETSWHTARCCVLLSRRPGTWHPPGGITKLA